MIDDDLSAEIEGGGYSVIARLVELGRRKPCGLEEIGTDGNGYTFIAPVIKAKEYAQLSPS